MQLEFRRLAEVERDQLIDLMNHPLVRRHLPLAKEAFGEAECEFFIATKERMWECHGFGPWAIFIDQEFAGWGGLQPEGEEIDLGLVLHPNYWGCGTQLCREIIAYGFEELSASSITMLLPPSRSRIQAVLRLGFEADQDVEIEGETFLRFRLMAPPPEGVA